MSTSGNSGKQELASTYFVQDRHSQQELSRLTVQGHIITSSMGGVLPEQTTPSAFHRVLDVACGPGEWIIDAAQTYPEMRLIGIDISPRMVTYANKRAGEHGLADRVEFHVMDALRTLEFPTAFFDLVNLRFGVSWLRTWDWPDLLREFLRIIRPGGVIRITEPEIIHQCNSQARVQFDELFQNAMFQSGHLFEHSTTGITAHLAPLLTRHGYQQVQAKTYTPVYHTGTPDGQAYYDDTVQVFQTLGPFLQKWGGSSTVQYDALCQQALEEMRRPDFYATWNILTAWGRVPDQILRR